MNEDNFIEEWLDHYPNRKMAYSEAANYLRSKQPEQQPVEEPDQWIPQSNLRQRSQPGHEDIPAMPDPRNMPDTLSDEEKPGMVAQFIKTIYPQAQLDDNIIAGIVGDFARPLTDNPAGPAMAGGVRDLGQGLVDVASEVSDALGLGPIDVELPQIESADDPAAHLVRGMTQFFAGFGAAGGLAKGATLMRQTLAGGAADATFDPELGNLSTLLREQFNVDNALVDYLDAKVGEDADAAERLNARVKMVLEGAGLGALAPAAMFTMRQMKEGAPESIQAVKDVIAGRPGNLQKQLGMVAFHGTPHKWESGVPDLSKVGTGEGAQAYGHGIYFAESSDVAKTYQPRDFDAEEIMMQKYKEAEAAGDYNRMEQWESAMLHDTPDEIRARSLDMDYDEDYRRAAAEVADELEAIPTTSHLYQVDIPDEQIDRMLDYDAPLKDQNDLVKEMLRDVLKEMKFLGPNDNGPRQLTSAWKAARMRYASMTDGDTGAAIYRVLGSRNTSSVEYLSRDPSLPAVDPAKLASEYLASKGIPGIKYLDQASRDAGKGTRNFVVFDEELLNKLKVGEAE